MAKIGSVENGLRRRKRKPRRKNPVAATATPRRRNVSLKTAKGVLAKNGLKAVSSKANPRRKRRRRRNGVEQIRRSNGILGNTKRDVTNVLALLGGMFGTKVVGRFLTPWAARLLAQVGMEKFAEIATDFSIGIVFVPFVANKLGGKGIAEMARLGGLGAVGMDALDLVAPDVLTNINPFSNSPVVLAGNQPLFTPGTVSNIAAQAAQDTAAKVAGVMNEIQAGADFSGGGQSMMNLPMLGVY